MSIGIGIRAETRRRDTIRGAYCFAGSIVAAMICAGIGKWLLAMWGVA